TGCSDLVANFVDSDRAHLVQDPNDIAVHRKQVSADRDFNFRICLMQLIETRQYLVIGHDLVVKGNHIAFADLDGDIILWPSWRSPSRSRQIDANTLHVGL